MPKRFSRYKFALKAVDGAPPAGTALARFKSYRDGSSTPTYTRAASSNPGELKSVYVIPFGEGADVYYLVTVSDRALGQQALVGGQAELKYLFPAGLPDAASSTESNKFSPATVTVFDPTGAPTTETSQITGVQYKKRTGASYSLPFGKAAAATGAAAAFKTRANAIKAAAETAAPENSVTFKPEILRAF